LEFAAIAVVMIVGFIITIIATVVVVHLILLPVFFTARKTSP